MNQMLVKKMLFALAIVLVTFSGVVAQQEKTQKGSDADFSAQIGKFTKRKVGEQKYTLAYKFKKGDVIRWNHDHQTMVETRFGTSTDKTSTRARPDYKWTVQNVDSRGTIRFDIEMERIKVLEQKGEADPINYNSDKDKEAPPICVPYQERVGRVSATYSISPNGQVVESKSNYHQIKLGGVGDNPVVAFPAKPISVGHKWDVTSFVRAKDEYGVRQQLKLRVRYVFEKVVDGKAHITFTTTVLAPHVDETVRSQLVTHLTRGFIVFDIEKGVLTNREIRWDERVIGYQGPESYMHYFAFRKESRVQEQEIATTQPVARATNRSDAKKDVVKKDVAKEKPQQTHALLQPLQPMKKK